MYILSAPLFHLFLFHWFLSQQPQRLLYLLCIVMANVTVLGPVGTHCLSVCLNFYLLHLTCTVLRNDRCWFFSTCDLAESARCTERLVDAWV